VTGDMSLTFSKWAPSETQGTVEVILTVVAGQKITLPASVTQGTAGLVGYNSQTNTITIASGVTRVHYNFSTIDCGTNVEISSFDGSRLSTQVQYRDFDVQNNPYSVVGLEGDVSGDIAYYSESLWVCTSTYNGTDSIWSPVGSGGGVATNPGSINTTIQFNDGGSFNGSANLTFNKTTSALAVVGSITGNTVTTSNLTVSGNANFSSANVKLELGNLNISNGSSGYVLSTDGSGVLSWIDPAGLAGNGSGTVNNGTASQLAIYSSTGTAVSSVANLTWASNTFTVGGNAVMPTASIDSLTINTTANFGTNAKVKIYGGTAGQVLASDGSGGLLWASQSSGSSGGGGVGTVNIGTATQMAVYSDTRAVSSVSNVTWNSNTFTVTGNITAGAVALSSATLSGNLSVTGNISANNITANKITTSGT
jgi:hypothetical protein